MKNRQGAFSPHDRDGYVVDNEVGVEGDQHFKRNDRVHGYAVDYGGFDDDYKDPGDGDDERRPSYPPSSSASSSSSDASSPRPRRTSPAPAKLPVVKIDNLFKTYLLGPEGVPALRGVNLDIHKGDFLAILGKSGGGKTTLLNVIGTIDRPTRGSLWLSGHRLDPKTSEDFLSAIRLTQIGFVFQTFNLLTSLTAVENVALPMTLLGRLSPAKIRARAEELLRQVGLGERLRHYPNMLSGGEQQRVTIARALSNEPPLLLLDEPTGDLDNHNTDLIMQMLYKLNRDRHITMVMVTHDAGLKEFCNRAVHVLDGKIQREEIIPTSIRREKYRILKRRIEERQSYQTTLRVSAQDIAEEQTWPTKTLYRGADDYPHIRGCLDPAS